MYKNDSFLPGISFLIPKDAPSDHHAVGITSSVYRKR
jgi:hypothetical protein